MIAVVVKHEVRRQGKPSSAVRPLHLKEYSNMLDIMRKGSHSQKLCFISVATLQWHAIARVDDMFHFKYENIIGSTDYPNVLLFKLQWSKNVTAGADCSEQFLLSSSEPGLDAILALAVFLFGKPALGHQQVRGFLN